jgi:hypothetical protein
MSFCVFLWEVGQKGHLQNLQLKARNPRKRFEMKVQHVVGLYV